MGVWRCVWKEQKSLSVVLCTELQRKEHSPKNTCFHQLSPFSFSYIISFSSFPTFISISMQTSFEKVFLDFISLFRSISFLILLYTIISYKELVYIRGLHFLLYYSLDRSPGSLSSPPRHQNSSSRTSPLPNPMSFLSPHLSPYSISSTLRDLIPPFREHSSLGFQNPTLSCFFSTSLALPLSSPISAHWSIPRAEPQDLFPLSALPRWSHLGSWL